MLTRIIVAVIGIPLLLAVMFFAPLWAYSGVVAAIAVIAAYEFTRCAAKGRDVWSTAAPAMVSAALIPVFSAFEELSAIVAAVPFMLLICLFIRLVLSFEEKGTREGLAEIFAAFFAGGVLPLMLSALVRLGSGHYGPVHMLLPFIITFSCDSGAYFTGVFLGKHKLAPVVSPNKTVEGGIGGLVCGIALCLLYGLVPGRFGFEVSYSLLAVYGLLGSLICQLGDLAFSAVKRVYGVKDYGSLLPGHGGALDRFDSVCFVAPAVELLMLLIPAII